MISLRPRALAPLALLAALVLCAFLLPVPRPAGLRAWALSAGSAAPVLFFLCYATVTVLPVPRSVFTLAAGLLLGPVTGIAVAITATAVSATLAFWLARTVGRRAVASYLSAGVIGRVDELLGDGGWLAVASLRMIPVVPFAPLNYCCGVLSVRPRPYLAGTVAGSLPGTVSIVLFGDALAGTFSPLSLAISACLGAVGAAGLVRTVRRTRPVRADS